jgi:hypothetical protein
METAEQPLPPAPKVSPTIEFLEKYLAMAKAGDIQSVMVGYVQKDGGAAVQTTPMSPVMLNHLSTLLERRVAREYDRALAKTSEARSPTGAMRANSPKTDSLPLPRKMRRQIELARKKEMERLAKRAKQNGAIIRRSTTG